MIELSRVNYANLSSLVRRKGAHGHERGHAQFKAVMKPERGGLCVLPGNTTP